MTNWPVRKKHFSVVSLAGDGRWRVSTLSWSALCNVLRILRKRFYQTSLKNKSCTHRDIRQGQHVSPNLLTIWNMTRVSGDTMEIARKNNDASDQEICWCVMYDLVPQGIKLYCISKHFNRRWHFFSLNARNALFHVCAKQNLQPTG